MIMNRFRMVTSNSSPCNCEPIYELIFICEPFEEKLVHKCWSVAQKDHEKERFTIVNPFQQKGSQTKGFTKFTVHHISQLM